MPRIFFLAMAFYGTLLGVIALVDCLLPVRSATKVDPIVALRPE